MSSKSSFTRPRHLKVHWDDEPDHELHGAVIYMKRLSVRDLRDMAQMKVTEEDDDTAAFDLILERVVDGLQSWNLIEESQPNSKAVPRPATREELESDAELTLAILDKWMAVAGSVSGPLAQRSNNGSQSPEVSALTDLPSASL